MSEVVRASHILLAYRGALRSTADRTREEALNRIQVLKSQLDNGADFAILAKECSDCPSKQVGGDLGSFTRGQMVEPFERASFSLPIGAVSEVVETQFGYHLIRRTS